MSINVFGKPDRLTYPSTVPSALASPGLLSYLPGAFASARSNIGVTFSPALWPVSINPPSINAARSSRSRPMPLGLFRIISVTFHCEKDLREISRGVLALPVALQLADQLDQLTGFAPAWIMRRSASL